MSKHTPGPWFVDEANPNLIQTADGDYICEVDPSSFSDSNHDDEQCEANARLIAGAPELLEALEAIIESVDAGSCAMLTHLQWAARAAIAKATGEHHDN